MQKKVIFVAGLPRSGSTLLCQLLNHHKKIYSSGFSSPVLHCLSNLRQGYSNDDFMLSQLEHDFDAGYQRIKGATRGFFNGWFENAQEPWVVDKNRGWLGALDLARTIAPDSYFIICVRELGQLYGSIETQHRKTVLLDSADGAAGKTPSARAAHYFNSGGVVNTCLNNVLSALHDSRPDELARIKVMPFENLVHDINGTMGQLFSWVGAEKQEIDEQKLQVMPKEADSFYRFKFKHSTYSSIKPIKKHWVADSVQNDLQNNYAWFYEKFYANMLKQSQ